MFYFSIVLYCIVLYCIVLYCIVLYCIVLYCIVLYCIVLYYWASQASTCVFLKHVLSVVVVVVIVESTDLCIDQPLTLSQTTPEANYT